MKLESNHKLVILVDSELPLGLIANTASVLSLTIGKVVDGIIGGDIRDGAGKVHLGITKIPIPILCSSKDQIKSIREVLFDTDAVVVDFCDAAQKTKNYEDYSQKLLASDNLAYLGIALIGDKKIINKYTGSLPLLR